MGTSLVPVNVYANRELILGIRPEDLLATDASAALPFAVETVESLGAATLAHGRFGGQSVVVPTAGRDRPLPDTKLGVTFATDTLHWFDPKDGRRIDAQQSAASAERNRDTRKLA